MPRRPNPVPSYRLHKQSGQAIVTVRTAAGGRRDVTLGVYDSPESKAEYARVLAEIRASPGAVLACPGGATVNEILLAFWTHAERHYRHPDGRPTSEVDNFKLSLRPLKALYGHAPAREFGPLALKAVRRAMADAGLARKVVNQRVGRVRRVFKWAAAEEMVPVTVYQALAAVADLAAGRTAAPDLPPVAPVCPAVVDATLPFLSRPVRGLVAFQRLTGCRPGEACAARRCDLDTAGPVWHYTPKAHKLSYRGKPRVIPVGPRAQAVLREYFVPAAAAFLFRPADAMAELRAAQRAARKTRLTPAQVCVPAANPKRKAGERYTARSYARAVATVCARAGVPHWHPNQLRHTHATEVRKRFGLEAAQVVLGHATANVTQVYAERDAALAERVAAAVG